MPPTKPPSTRGSAKKATTQKTSASAETEDVKPNVEPFSGSDLPSDPLIVQPEPVLDSTAPRSPVTSTSSVTGPHVPTGSTRGAASASRGRRLLSQPKYAGRRSQTKRDELQKEDEENRKAEAETKAAEKAAKARQEARKRDGARGGNLRGRGRGGYTSGSGQQNQRSESTAGGLFSAGQISLEEKLARRGRRVRGTTRISTTRSGRGGNRKASDTAPSNATPGGQKKSTAARSTRADVSKESTRNGTTSTNATGNGSLLKQEPVEAVDSKPIVDGDGDVSMELRRDVRTVDGGYISSDDDDDATGKQRVNVEDLGVIDLTQDDVEYDPFAPVRVLRVEHKDRAQGINADGATNQDGVIAVDANDSAIAALSEKKKGKQKAKDLEVTAEKKVFHPVYSDSEDEAEPQEQIKPEPDGRAQAAGTPEPVLASSTDMLPQDPPSSPETKRKAKEKIKASLLSDVPTNDMPSYQTHEEVEEWERHQEDLMILREELGVPAHAADEDNEDDDAMTESRTKDTDIRANNVYLFQFPPVLPDLLPITVKPDPDAANGHEQHAESEAMEVDPPNNQQNPLLISDEDKSEPPPQPKIPSGAVGKLKVHKSGRVTLDWGGTSLSLGMGTQASFLQNVLVATLPDDKTGGVAGDAGLAMSMGQVERKFIITPDWEGILR